MADETTRTSTTEAPAPAADWTAELDDDARGVLKAKGWEGKSPKVILDAYRQAERVIGAEKLPLPPKSPDGERDFKAWDGWSALGVPETPDAYEFEVMDGGEATPIDEAYQAALREAAHAAKLAPWQLKELNKAHNTVLKQVMEAEVEADKAFAAETDRKLRTEWGADYKVNKVLVEDVWREALGDDFEEARKIQTKDGRLLLDHPLMSLAAHRLAPAFREDSSVGRAMSPAGGRRTAAAVNSELKAVRSEFAAQLTDARHPQHTAALNRVNNLVKELMEIEKRARAD